MLDSAAPSWWEGTLCPSFAARALPGAVPGQWPGPEEGGAPRSWSLEIDPADRLTQAHSRHILHAGAQRCPPLARGCPEAVRISVCGDSFILYQVRALPQPALAPPPGLACPTSHTTWRQGLGAAALCCAALGCPQRRGLARKRTPTRPCARVHAGAGTWWRPQRRPGHRCSGTMEDLQVQGLG